MKSLLAGIVGLVVGLVAGKFLLPEKAVSENTPNASSKIEAPVGKMVTGDSLSPPATSSDDSVKPDGETESAIEGSSLDRLKEMVRSADTKSTNFDYRSMMDVGNLIFSMDEAEVVEAIEFLTSDDSQMGMQSQWMYLSSVFARYGEIDPKRAFEASQDLSGRVKMIAGSGALMSWASKDLEGALAHVEGMEQGMARTQMLSTVISSMAGKDPLKAIEYASKMEGAVRQSSFSQIGWAWGSQDPEAAMEYAESMDDAFLKKHLRQSVVSGWAMSEPSKAANYLLENPPEDQNSGGLNQVMSNWMQSDPKGAVEFLKEMPEDKRPDNFFQSISWSLGSLPNESVEEVGQLITNDTEKGQFYSSLATARVNNGSPQEGLSFLEKIPEGDQRNSGFRNVADNWARTDPYKSSEWLDTLPEGADRDWAISGFTNQIVGLSPESALRWAESISDEKKRGDTVRNLASRWKGKDKEAALEYVETSDILTEEQKEQLRK